MSSTGETYKPSEHGGLKEDGTPDKRMQQTEFAYGKVDPHGLLNTTSHQY